MKITCNYLTVKAYFRKVFEKHIQSIEFLKIIHRLVFRYIFGWEMNVEYFQRKLFQQFQREYISWDITIFVNLFHSENKLKLTFFKVFRGIDSSYKWIQRYLFDIEMLQSYIATYKWCFCLSIFFPPLSAYIQFECTQLWVRNWIQNVKKERKNVTVVHL